MLPIIAPYTQSYPPEKMSYFRNLTEEADSYDDVYLVLEKNRLEMHNQKTRQWMCIHKQDNLFSIRNECTEEWLIVEANQLKMTKSKQGENFSWEITRERSESVAWAICPSNRRGSYLTYV